MIHQFHLIEWPKLEKMKIFQVKNLQEVLKGVK